MKYFRYWIKDEFPIQIGGSPQEITILSGSNVSEADAAKKAKEQASIIEERIQSGTRKEEYESSINEYVERVIDDSNIVTICRYGAKILNTDEYTILDLDDYPVDIFDIFRSVRTLPKKERIVAKFLERVAKNPEIGTDFRIYETAKGIRVIGKKYINPENKKYIKLMRSLNVDWLYVFLSKRQKCYRARLTPKPYRLKIKTIRITSPLTCTSDDYTQWEKMYTDSSNKYSVAKYLTSLGQDFGGDRVINFHDEVCRSHSNLKLA